MNVHADELSPICSLQLKPEKRAHAARHVAPSSSRESFEVRGFRSACGVHERRRKNNDCPRYQVSRTERPAARASPPRYVRLVQLHPFHFRRTLHPSSPGRFVWPTL